MWKTYLKNVNKLGEKRLDVEEVRILSFYKMNYPQKNYYEFPVKTLFKSFNSVVHSFNTPNSSNKFYI